MAIKTFIRRFDDSILCPFIASIALKASDAFEYFMYATPKTNKHYNVLTKWIMI